MNSLADPIAIIGAGIGGLTTALALQKAGVKVVVFEGAPEIKPVGAGIAMASNAMQVFDRLGVRNAIENAGHRITKMVITDHRLRTLSSTSLEKFERKYGLYNVAIHRADLQRILAESLGFEHIHLSKRLRHIEERNGYDLTFEDGTHWQCNSLIGADGIRSTVRNQLFQSGKIRDTGQRCWRGVSVYSGNAAFTHHAYEAWGKGKRFGFVKVDDRRVYWYAVVNQELQDGVKTLSELFGDFHPEILEMIEMTPTEDVIFNDLIDLKPFHRWHHGRACIIGDAAHASTPNLGQGACQAVEDAFVLGQLFAKNLTVEEVFNRYEKLRKNKAHLVVNSSWKIGVIAHYKNEIACSVRNNLLKILPSVLQERQLERLFDINYPIL